MCPGYFLCSLKLILRGWLHHTLGSILCPLHVLSTCFLACLAWAAGTSSCSSSTGIRLSPLGIFIYSLRLEYLSSTHTYFNGCFSHFIQFCSHISLYKWDFRRQSYLNNIPPLLLRFSFLHCSYHNLTHLLSIFHLFALRIFVCLVHCCNSST